MHACTTHVLCKGDTLNVGSGSSECLYRAQAVFLHAFSPLDEDAVLSLALIMSPPRVLVGLRSGRLEVHPVLAL